jgi:hypothetical protein
MAKNLPSDLYEYLTPAEKQEVVTLLAALPVWEPDPRNVPQCTAYKTKAFETLYGGAAGGGKSDLLLGLARNEHVKSLVLRREFPDLERSLISRSLEFYAKREFYNSSRHLWRIPEKGVVRNIEFGHMERVGTPQDQGDEAQYAGAAYDFIGIDQLEQFPQYAYEFITHRARRGKNTPKGVMVQVMATANPVGEGVSWIMQHWRAWLIDQAAQPGELLWYKRNANGEEVQTDAKDPDAVSRTYFPAGLKDNPYLGDDYRRILQMMPEPLRSAMLNGDWNASLVDDAYQVIPRAWVRKAQSRWREENEPMNFPLIVGGDVARGGDDKTVFAPRRGDWFGRLHKHPGITTPDGQSVITLLAQLVGKKDRANIDVIGVGASAYDLGRERRMNVYAVNFAERSDKTDRSGTLHFINKRAELYWMFRDALDPRNERAIALPPDPELEADLCAPRWSSQTNGIKIESKDDIKKRLGRSPDCGDAVVLAFGDYTGVSDEEIERYGKDANIEADLTDDLIEYRMTRTGETYEQARAALLKESKG